MEEGEGEGLTTPGLPVVLNLAGRLVVVVGGGAVGARKASAALAAGAVVRVVDPVRPPVAHASCSVGAGSVSDGLVAPVAHASGSDKGTVAHASGSDKGTVAHASGSDKGTVAHASGSDKGTVAHASGSDKGTVAHASGSDGPDVHIPEPYRPEHLDGAFLVFACATPEVNARVAADARARGILVNSATDPVDCDFTLPSVVRSGGLTLAVSTGGAAPALARRIREKLEAEFDAAFADWVRVLAEVRAVVLAEVADPQRRRELLDGFADWPWLERVRVEGADAVRAAMLAAWRSR